MHVILRGRKYNVLSKKLKPELGGICSNPKAKNPTIVVCSSIEDSDLFFENLIHECTHACNWDWDEEAVEEFAHDLAALLLKVGATFDLAKAKELLKVKSKNK